jgi:hypothetical protein
MRLAAHSRIIASALAITAIAAPAASARPNLEPNWTAQSQTTTASPELAPTGGFDYGDAAIGAGITATIAVLITGGSLAARQRSQPRHP